MIKVEAFVSSDGEASRAVSIRPLQNTVLLLSDVTLRKEAELVLVELELGPGDGSVVKVARDALEAGGFSCGEIAHEGSHAVFGSDHRRHLIFKCV